MRVRHLSLIFLPAVFFDEHGVADNGLMHRASTVIAGGRDNDLRQFLGVLIIFLDNTVDVFVSVELRVGFGVSVEPFNGGDEHVPAGLFVSAEKRIGEAGEFWRVWAERTKKEPFVRLDLENFRVSGNREAAGIKTYVRIISSTCQLAPKF
jgi:hypothetical protein